MAWLKLIGFIVIRFVIPALVLLALMLFYDHYVEDR